MHLFRTRVAQKVAVLAVVGLLAGVLPLLTPTAAEKADAATASAFDPGNLISDANFFNGSAMSAAQVQSFLNENNAGCNQGSTCLPQYAQSTVSIKADEYCDAYSGSSRESAASIIAKVGKACDISQRALIVLLEKEQSLVTHRSPNAARFAKATGFGCPDTAPCDASVDGFFYQMYYGARQFQRYAAHPENFNHRSGVDNRILYHPNYSCGASTVRIKNQATAGLYNYTPYQPNAAAMQNLYGTGNSCSAYGNRNFWRIYTDWFGDPVSIGDNALVRNTQDGKVYLLAGSMRHHVPSRAILADYTPAFGRPADVSASTLAKFKEGPAANRAVLGASGGALLIDNGKASRFTSCGQAEAFGYSCGALPRLTSALQSRLSAGGTVQAIVRARDGHDWLIRGGGKRELADVALPTRYGYASSSIRLDADVLANLKIGEPIMDARTAVRDHDSRKVRVRTSRGYVALTPEQSGFAAMRPLKQFEAASIAKMPAGGGTVTSSRLRDGNAAYLVTDGGLLQVSAAKYGGQTKFPTRSDISEIRAALPRAGTNTGAHFVRANGTDRVYLASGPKLRAIKNPQEYREIRDRYGVPPRVWIVPSGTLNDIPKS